MRPELLIPVANVVAAVLTSLAVAGVYPTLSPVFTAVAGLLAGWVNAGKPGAAAKAVAKAEAEKAES